MNDFPLSESDIFCVKLMIAIAILGELRIAELHVDLFLYGPLLPKLLKFGKNYQNPSNQSFLIAKQLSTWRKVIWMRQIIWSMSKRSFWILKSILGNSEYRLLRI